jgi:fructuronate reductase
MIMPRILHLGVGNFFRAHQAWYTQSCPDWRITGVSFRSPSIRDRLEAQGYAYALVTKDASGTRIDPITCLDKMLVVAENPSALIAAIADPAVAVVTLTITEKGYHLGPDGTLDLDTAALREDLNGGALTPVGALARGLAARDSPVTVLSCDNLPDNGRKLGAAVAAFAKAADLTLTGKVTFPSCMVDRITPATTEAIRAEAQDGMAVPTEGFTEWVIEDNFAAARPDWPGVQWVSDVAPHEMRKLRMLNGAHSYLAYAGVLRGHSFVHQAVADPVLRAGARAIMDEAATTLPADVQAQASTYATALITRFENPNLHHQLHQIAMDGTQKLPIRIVATLRDRGDLASPGLISAVAAWVAFVRAEVAAGRLVDDPMANAIEAACKANDPGKVLRQLIGLP